MMKVYPEYRETGLTWLGEMPGHWDVRRNGRLFAQRNETGHSNLPILEVSLKTGVRVRDMDNLKRKQVMADPEKYKRAAKGDVAYNMMRMWQGAVGVAPVDGLVSPAYVVVRPYPEADPRYFSYLFRTDAYMGEIDGYSRGIVKDRNRLYWQDFKRMPSCVPPVEEQASIANFLDANAVTVNRFIRNRRRLIEVLTEQKQVIINRAVTRGLNSNAPLKPSGIDWLGDIPAHWIVRKFSSLFKRTGSGTTPSGNEHYGGGVPWVMTGDLNNGLITTTQRTVTQQALQDVSALRLFPSGSLIVALYGATIGKTGVLQMDACTNQACCVLAEPRSNVNVRYLQQFVNMARPQLVQQSYGGGQPNINSDIVRSLRIPLPPETEQDSLLASLETKTRGISDAIQTATREIDLIHEYRTRLIADVVTGKLDVRHLAKVELLPNDEVDIAALTDDFEDEGVISEDEPELVEEAET